MTHSVRLFADGLAVAIFVAMCLALTNPSKAEAAASGLTLSQACEPDGTVTLILAWQGISPSATELGLDVNSNNSWKQAGPLSPNLTRYVWPGFPAAATYYFRVNQMLGDGTWDPSGVVGFASGGCNQNGLGSQGTNTNASSNSVSSTGYAPGVSVGSASSGVNVVGPNPNPLTYYTPNLKYTTPNVTYPTPNATYSTPNPTYFTPNPVHQMGAQVSSGGGAASGDYDCEGGDGDGPNYIQGPIQIVGPDTHGLDADGDGIGCE